MMRRDVVVIGAGPAGALAAREVARRGSTVLLLDRSPFPRMKVCGGCLSAGAVDVLRSVGLGHVPVDLRAPSLHSLHLSAEGRTARLELAGGYAVSRATFDEALVEEARSAGAEWWRSARARLGEHQDGARVVRVETPAGPRDVRAGLVLDATGLGTSLGAEARGAVRRGSRLGLGAALDDDGVAIEPGEVHMAVAATGYVGLVRDGRGVLNVAAAIDPACLQDASPAEAIVAVLTSAGCQVPGALGGASVKGTPPLTWEPPDLGGARLLRLGDAAGYVEPFTGEGMCWAMSAAVAVAPLAAEGAVRWSPDILNRWRQYHRQSLAKGRRLCRALTPLLRHPTLVAAAIVTLGRAPALAHPLVSWASRAPRLAVASAT